MPPIVGDSTTVCGEGIGRSIGGVATTSRTNHNHHRNLKRPQDTCPLQVQRLKRSAGNAMQGSRRAESLTQRARFSGQTLRLTPAHVGRIGRGRTEPFWFACIVGLTIAALLFVVGLTGLCSPFFPNSTTLRHHVFPGKQALCIMAGSALSGRQAA
jgi:hypothetical protein